MYNTGNWNKNNEIKRRRKQLGFSLEDVAERCQSTRQTVSRWENNEGSEMTIMQALRLCNMLKCDIGYLLGEYQELTQQVAEICSYTGLSETVVEKMHEWKNADDRVKFYPRHLSQILESEDIEGLFEAIVELIAYKTLEFRAFKNDDCEFALELLDRETSRLWNISRIFSNIIESIDVDKYGEEDK